MSTERSGHWIGFDLGGTKMHAVLFDPQMQVVARRRKKTRGHEGADAGIERICAMIEKLCDEAKIPQSELAGIGMGIPGPIDMESGVILGAPNLGWKDVPLKATLEKRLGCPVVVCNDVDAGIYGEYTAGAARGARTALGVFPGTGIGGGMVYEGQIYRGKNSSCLEIGHVIIDPGGTPCGCGRRGCLETVASRLAISAEIAKAAYRGQAPHLLRVAGTDLANIRSGTLAESILAGDKIVEQIVRDGARKLGTTLAGFVNVLMPDCIVLGGGLVEALPELYLEEVSNELNSGVMPAFARSLELSVAELGDDAGVIGTATWAQHVLQHNDLVVA
ncbi:MAG: ROK family protein [Planctomycetaceae bacterium]|nr:ROK family protein [Planctomycetaceae bacterium]